MKTLNYAFIEQRLPNVISKYKSNLALASTVLPNKNNNSHNYNYNNNPPTSIWIIQRNKNGYQSMYAQYLMTMMSIYGLVGL